jgi:hypothetical protein
MISLCPPAKGMTPVSALGLGWLVFAATAVPGTTKNATIQVAVAMARK